MVPNPTAGPPRPSAIPSLAPTPLPLHPTARPTQQPSSVPPTRAPTSVAPTPAPSTLQPSALPTALQLFQTAPTAAPGSGSSSSSSNSNGSASSASNSSNTVTIAAVVGVLVLALGGACLYVSRGRKQAAAEELLMQRVAAAQGSVYGDRQSEEGARNSIHNFYRKSYTPGPAPSFSAPGPGPRASGASFQAQGQPAFSPYVAGPGMRPPRLYSGGPQLPAAGGRRTSQGAGSSDGGDL